MLPVTRAPRSEEHTSELQSHHDLVCRLLLEKKKKRQSELLHHQNQFCRLRRRCGQLHAGCNHFFFNDTATPEIYTLSLHDALPTSGTFELSVTVRSPIGRPTISGSRSKTAARSEEHTSELQSHHDLVCRLLLE